MNTYSITMQRGTPNQKTVTFESELTEVEVVSGLKQVPGNFARNLRNTLHWTKSQEGWAHWMVIEAARKASQPETAPQATGFKAIPALFATASASLQYPRITFKTSAGTVRIQRAGQQSRYAGELQVTDGQGYGQSRYYGRIDKAGNFHPGRDFSGAVTAALTEIEANPAEALGRMGRAEGVCCFCGKDLTDEASTDHGYGPVCAKNWGLPHGAAKIDVTDLKLVAYL